jgi:hypothetical protein
MPRRSVSALIKALSDEDGFVQSSATAALAEIDTPQAAAALRSAKAHVQGAWTWYVWKGEPGRAAADAEAAREMRRPGRSGVGHRLR